MKHYVFYLSILLSLWAIPIFAQLPNEFYYVNAINSSSKSDVVKIIQDELTGDYIVAGTYRGSVFLDPTVSAPTYSGTVGSLSSYIAKYDMSGNYLWSISLYGDLNDTTCITSIDVGLDGYIYAVGYYNDSLKTSYPSTILYNLTRSASGCEGFVARINPYEQNDVEQYLLPVGNAATATRTYVNDCKYVNNFYGDVLILGGSFMGSNVDLNLDNTNVSYKASTANTYSGFITAFRASDHGTPSAFDPYTTDGSATGNHIHIQKLCIPITGAVATDTLNYVGVFNGTTQLSPALTSIGGDDILMGITVVSFGSTGIESISHYGHASIGSLGNDEVNDVVLNASNDIFLSGYYNGPSMDVDPSANTVDIGISSDIDAFLVKYTNNFNYLKGGKFYGSGKEKITSLSLWDPDGDTLLIGGYFTGTNLTYNSTNLFTNTATGTSDGFMNLITTSGTSFGILTSTLIGSPDNEFINSVLVSDFGEAISAGSFSGTVDFDNSSAIHQETAMSSISGFMCFYGQDLSSFVDSYSSGDADDEITGIGIDEKGDIFAIGTYTGSINIGTGTLNSAGGTDVFIQKKNKNGANQWAFNAGRTISGTVSIQDICNKINSTVNDKGKAIITSDTSIYIAYVKNDTAYTQRVNKNTGGPVWTQKINQNGSNISGITEDAKYVYIVGDSAGVQITQRVNKNTGGPVWTQRSAGGKSKAITQDKNSVYTVKDSSGHTVVSRVNKNTGGPVWTQRIANNSGSGISEIGEYLYIMSDSAGSVMLRKVNKNTGGPVWTQRIANGTLGSVTVNPGNENLYITGVFTGSSSYLGLTSSGGTDGFVARVNKNTGGPVWTQRVGGSGADSIKTLQVTAGNDIYIGGNTQGGTFGTNTASAGVFLVRLSVDSLDRFNSIEPVKTNHDGFDCQVYPNPTYDMFNISAVLSKMEFVQIRMIDLKGTIVYQEVFGNQNNIQKTIDIGELSPGLYLLQIQAGDKQVIRKVIKQ